MSTNMNEIEFNGYDGNEQIPVNKETKALLCVENKSKSKIKIQITSAINNEEI